MAVPLALGAAWLTGGTIGGGFTLAGSAGLVTGALGVAAHLARGLLPFRGPGPLSEQLPPLAQDLPSLGEMLQDLADGMRVPSGFVPPGGPNIPNPLPGLLGQLQRHLQKPGGQEWGQLNQPLGPPSPAIPVPADPAAQVNITGKLGAAGFFARYRPAGGAGTTTQGTNCEIRGTIAPGGLSGWQDFSGSVQSITVEKQSDGSPCGTYAYIRFFLNLSGGQKILFYQQSGGGTATASVGIEFDTADPNATDAAPAGPRQNPLPFRPLIGPADAAGMPGLPVPGFLPLIQPAPVPDAEPLGDPITEPLPETAPLPAVPVRPPLPAAPAWTSPQPEIRPRRTPQAPPATFPATGPGRNPRRINNDGTVAAPAAPPVAVTPAKNTYPIPGGAPLVGNGPRPNLSAIAAELGNLEQKMEGMMRGGNGNNPSPEWLDDLIRLFFLAQQIYDALTLDVGGTVYEMTAPCDRDQDGNFQTWEAGIPPADYLPAIVSRLDAVMDALRQVNSWKRTVCRTPTPPGNVTITAYSVEEA